MYKKYITAWKLLTLVLTKYHEKYDTSTLKSYVAETIRRRLIIIYSVITNGRSHKKQ